MNQLQVTNHGGQRVLSTAQLAEAYNADVKIVSNNFNRNKGRYKEGKHYFLLQGEELRIFKAVHQNDEQLKFATALYLWTEKGAWLHAKSLNTDQAWEAYEMLVDDYYAVKEVSVQSIESFLLNPDTIIKIAENWKAEQTLRIAAESQIEKDKPKVIFAEALEVSRDSILIADLAKILRQNNIDIGEIRLFKLLREQGYLIKSGSEYNMPTQRSMDLKIMEIKVGYRGSASEGTKVTRTTKITGKGINYFINKFKGESQLA